MRQCLVRKSRRRGRYGEYMVTRRGGWWVRLGLELEVGLGLGVGLGREGMYLCLRSYRKVWLISAPV